MIGTLTVTQGSSRSPLDMNVSEFGVCREGVLVSSVLCRLGRVHTVPQSVRYTEVYEPIAGQTSKS